jgi:hypothetical protein
MHATVREETPKEAAYRLNKPSLRPVDYTQEIGSTICDRLFAGETLSEICRDAAMPDKSTVMRWLAQDPKFLDEICVHVPAAGGRSRRRRRQHRRQCGH